MPLLSTLGKLLHRARRTGYLLGLLALLLIPGRSRAQANQGLVPDSTESRILRQFYYGTHFGGINWRTNTNWPSSGPWPANLTSADFATWFGLTVTNGDVTGISLSQNNLSGSLPASLGQLAQLQTLDVGFNGLNGTIPASLGQLTQLQILALNSNRLWGTIPGELGHLTQLRTLSLYHTALSGAIPPSLGQLSHLQQLELVGCTLTGAIPAELGQLAQLQELLLGRNQLSGPIPASLSQLGNLTYLSLAQNQLSGPLPSSFGQLAQLGFLDASYNQLSGPIPPSLGQLAALYDLEIGNNQFSGPIPAELGQLTNLQTLYLFGNQLSGPIPVELGQLTRLQQLYLYDNQLSGALPGSLGQLSQLSTLSLSNNQLSGPIPPALGQLRNLENLVLDYNELSAAIPSELSNLTSLRYLFLNNNQLSGTFPTALGKIPNLYLTVAANNLTDVADLGGLSGLPASLTIWNNYLDFTALERLYQGPNAARLRSLSTSPQLPPPHVDTTSFTLGRALVLQPRRQGLHTYQYQWQRLVSGQWVEMPGDTLATKTWPASTTAEQGTYRRREHDRWFTDPRVGPTELYSAAIYTDLLPYQPLTRNRPDDRNQGVPVLLTPLPAPDAQASAPADMNYVRTWIPRVPLTSPPAGPVAVDAPPTWTVDQASQSTQYLDGLGRPVQTVLHQASPARRDLVQPRAYDGLGREPRAYLPYVDSLHDGSYRYRALSEQQQFYLSTGVASPGGVGPPAPGTASSGVARTGVAYAETLFENSPLSRVVAQAAPGEAWRLTGGHAQLRTERPNGLPADSVLRFTPGYDPHSRDPGYQGLYAAGELWGTQTTDEQGFRTMEWQDKLGQLVQKQVETARLDTAGPQPRRWLRTCYVYDDFAHLRYVLQPEASKRVLALGTRAAALPAGATPYLFHYRYDGRGRQIAKQVPGQAGETLVVYDQLDRPVLSQDAQQRSRREWSWTKYDALGRVILSGLVTRADTLGQLSLQNLAAADTATTHQYEQRTANAARFPQYYTTTQAFPRLAQPGQLSRQGFGAGQVLSVTRYDDYNFNNDPAGRPDVTYNTSTNGRFPRGQAPVADARRTTGLVTQTSTRVLGVAENDRRQTAWLTTTTFYDARARPVQVQTTSARRDTLTRQPYRDLLTTQLDFTGKVVQSVASHQGPSHMPVQVAEFFTYDHTGRLLTTRQQVPGEAQPALLASVQYNELGQVVRKTIGTGRLKQDVDYAYNIRGWLTSLNDPYSPNPTKHDLFHLSLHYERGFTRGYEQYGGNLTGQTWRGRDGVQRAYGYVYDPLNRLLQGDFVARQTTTPATPSAGLWKAEEDNYRLSFVSYDDNGNILTLRRRGLLQAATAHQAKQYGAVDALTYAYAGNRLLAVDDAVSTNQLPRPKNYHGAPASLAGDFQEQGVKLGEEYLYDANGNLTQDKNKGITGIAYNYLNLPRQIHFGQVGDSIVFRYTAAGQKVAKLVYQTGKPTPLRTDYLGPYQYEQDSLKFFPHAEGRVLRFVSKDPAGQATVSYQREYTMKDHLGNLRLAYRLGQVRTLTATLEQDKTTHDRESQQFDSLSVSAPVAQATSLAHSGSYVAKLNAGGSTPQPLGPLTQLGVQKGDTVTVTAFGYYAQPVQHGFFFTLGSFLAGLFHPAQAPAPGLEASKRKSLPLLQVGVAAGLSSLPQLSGGVPKGYLRVLVFDQDSALVAQPVQALSQAANGGYEPLRLQVLVPQDGYVTAYVGNDSDVDVLFDDVSVEHRPGLQVQETQYDPAGLELAGLAQPSPGIRGLNNYRFNGKEFQADLGLSWNHQDWRFFDPQLLRWHAGDPEVENGQESWTPYSFGYDNAVRYADANGREPGDPPFNPFSIAVNTFVGIGVSLVNTVLMAGDALGPGGYAVAVMSGNSTRATNNGDGTVSYSNRSAPTSGRELAGYAGADLLDGASAVLTVSTLGSGGVASRGLPMAGGYLFEQGAGKVAQNEVVQEGKTVLKQFSGTARRMEDGATPNSIYTHLNKNGTAQNNYIYNSEGKLSAEVNFQQHGKAKPGHGHTMEVPGKPGSGHGRAEGKHIHASDIPEEWQKLPAGIKPLNPVVR